MSTYIECGHMDYISSAYVLCELCSKRLPIARKQRNRDNDNTNHRPTDTAHIEHINRQKKTY